MFDEVRVENLYIAYERVKGIINKLETYLENPDVLKFEDKDTQGYKKKRMESRINQSVEDSVLDFDFPIPKQDPLKRHNEMFLEIDKRMKDLERAEDILSQTESAESKFQYVCLNRIKNPVLLELKYLDIATKYAEECVNTFMEEYEPEYFTIKVHSTAFHKDTVFISVVDKDKLVQIEPISFKVSSNHVSYSRDIVIAPEMNVLLDELDVISERVGESMNFLDEKLSELEKLHASRKWFKKAELAELERQLKDPVSDVHTLLGYSEAIKEKINEVQNSYILKESEKQKYFMEQSRILAYLSKLCSTTFVEKKKKDVY